MEQRKVKVRSGRKEILSESKTNWDGILYKERIDRKMIQANYEKPPGFLLVT